MPTRFTSLGISGTATIATLVATAATLTTVAITTSNVTTSNVTTANIQTLSGATAVFTEVGDSVEATTLSGGSIRTTAGLSRLTNAGLVQGATVSGATVRANAFTGGTLQIQKISAGSGKVAIFGNAGSYVCFWDSDAAGWTMTRALNGVLTSTIAGPTMCP